jgi:hypothetical protein
VTPYDDPISQLTAYNGPLGPAGPARPHDPDGGPRGAAAGGRRCEGAR